MNPSPNLPKGIWGGKTAFVLGAVFLLFYALGTVLVRQDAAQRAQIEALTPLPLDTGAPRQKK